MLSIRRMLPGDCERVAELAGQLDYPSTRDEIARRFEEIGRLPEHAIFVAEQAGYVVGWTHVRGERALESAPKAEIAGLVVAADARRIGAGRALVEAADRWARDHGFAALNVRSNVLRDVAHRFYPSLGFTLKKTQHVYRRELK